MPHLGLVSPQTPAGRATQDEMALSYDIYTMGPIFPRTLEAMTYGRPRGVGLDWSLSRAVKIHIVEYLGTTLKWNTSQSTLHQHLRGCKNIEEEQRVLPIQVVWLSSCSPEASLWNAWAHILWHHFSEEANVPASALGLYLRKSSRPTEDFLG